MKKFLVIGGILLAAAVITPSAFAATTYWTSSSTLVIEVDPTTLVNPLAPDWQASATTTTTWYPQVYFSNGSCDYASGGYCGANMTSAFYLDYTHEHSLASTSIVMTIPDPQDYSKYFNVGTYYVAAQVNGAPAGSAIPLQYFSQGKYATSTPTNIDYQATGVPLNPATLTFSANTTNQSFYAMFVVFLNHAWPFILGGVVLVLLTLWGILKIKHLFGS